MPGCERSAEGYRVRLFCRGSVPPAVREQQAETIARLEGLRAEHDLQLEVTAWPRAIDLEPVGVAEPSRDLLETFRDWARAQGYSLSPALDTRRRVSWISAEERVSVSLPMMLLAVYEDDDIAAIYPHADGDEVRTVAEGIAELESLYGDEPERTGVSLSVAD